MLGVVQVVRQQQCNGHCLCDCPSTAVETASAQCISRWAMARGHRLNTSIVLAAVHGLSGLFRAVSAVEPSLSRPLPLLSPSLISNLASVDVKQHGQGHLLHPTPPPPTPNHLHHHHLLCGFAHVPWVPAREEIERN